MKITREAIIEAIKLSKDVLPKFTAFEMARVLGVPVKYLLKSIQANLKNFKFDAEKNIVSLDCTSRLQNINSNEVWGWYLKNKLGGDTNACLAISDQTRLMASLNSRIKWDLSFGLVAATFASQEISGTDVRNRVSQVYSPALTSRLIKLGTVSGSGQVPDRYVFGIVLTPEEIADRKIEHIPLYSPEWALEDMMQEVDWVDVEVPNSYEVLGLPPPGDLVTPPSEPGNPNPGNGGVGTPASPEDTQKILAGAGSSKPPIPGAVQRTRRTREQIDEDHKKMIKELTDRGMFAQDEIDTVAKAKSIGEAEKAFKTLMANADALEAKERAKAGLPGQQQLFTDTQIQPPESPTQVFVPNTVEKTMQHIPPALNSAPPVPASLPPVRPTMPKLADLEKVPDIKAQICADAGMPAPPSVSTTQVTPPIAAQSFAQQAPPVSNPPPAGGSASAEDLLNGLLKSTGQIPS